MLEDAHKILAMAQNDLVKHEYLKYRIKRLDDIYPWLSEKIRTQNLRTMPENGQLDAER